MLSFIEIIKQAIQTIQTTKDINTLEKVRIQYLGKKGYFSQQIALLRNLDENIRPIIGKKLNQAKQKIQKELEIKRKVFNQLNVTTSLKQEKLDISLPGKKIGIGGLHPISKTIMYIENFFKKMGFSIVTGPEIEDSYYNFDALNIPINHPARSKNDTFWFDDIHLLRTQTSSIQFRTMQSQSLPIRTISSGRVYRNDCDRTHTPMFHQIEGLVIDHNVSFAHLKGILYNFLCHFFEKNLQIRFRPSYFPFTEPSAEIDIIQQDHNILEVLGCGLIHPKILKHANIDSKQYSGFAFGIGIERLIMLRYGISDLRTLFENDLRFLNQFK